MVRTIKTSGRALLSLIEGILDFSRIEANKVSVTEEDFDPATAIIGDHMSSPLRTAPHSTRIYKLEDMFLGLFLRHLPIEKDGKFIGMLSIGDVLRASLLEKDRQFKHINDFVSWDFYENWKVGRKKLK